MGIVMIRCPTTGREISTGIETDAASFAAVPDVLAHSPCPWCGLEHAWWKREAWLCEPSGSAAANAQTNRRVPGSASGARARLVR
jgi:hypothetical protein